MHAAVVLYKAMVAVAVRPVKGSAPSKRHISQSRTWVLS